MPITCSDTPEPDKFCGGGPRKLRHWRDGRGRRARSPGTGVAAIVRVYIACAHLNHDPADNSPRNLAALCQRCRMIHDAAEHRRRRWLNAYRRRSLGDFLAAIEWMPIVAVVDPTTRGSTHTLDETRQVARSDARWAGERAVPGRAAPDLFL